MSVAWTIDIYIYIKLSCNQNIPPTSSTNHRALSFRCKTSRMTQNLVPTLSTYLKNLFQLLGFGILSYTLLLTYDHPTLEKFFEKEGGRTRFLTMWGLFFSILTFMSGVLVGLFPNNHFFRDLKKVSGTISMPLESVITTLYWSIVLLKPELMVDPSVNLELPPISIDLALHLYPIILHWIDFFFLSDRLTTGSNNLTRIRLSNGTQIRVFNLVIIIALAYASWIEIARIGPSKFTLPYPFLEIAPISARVLIYIGAASICYIHFITAEILHHWILSRKQANKDRMQLFFFAPNRFLLA